MFEMLDELDHEDGSQQRYESRGVVHQQKYGDRKRYLFWWLVHNVVAHPLIGVCPLKFAFDFHDATSRKINAK